MNKIKALIILPAYSVGGAEKVMFSYFNNFKHSKIDLSLLISNSKRKKKISDSKNLMEFNYRKFIFMIPKLVSLVKKNNFRVIISTFPNVSVYLIILRCLKIINSKIIIRQPNVIGQSLNQSIKLRFIKFIYILIIKYADAVIVTSRYMQQEAIKNRISKNKIFFLKNPIDPKNIRKGLSPIRFLDETIKLIFVGRLVYQKGIDRVLGIIKSIKQIKLIIIGEGKEKNRLLEMVKKLKIEKRVTFLGFKKNPFKYVSGADYFLLPSRWEGLPNCVLESLALGTPVLAFNQIYALNDFEEKIKNKSIILSKNEYDLEKILKELKKRKDYKKPKLRKNLLNKYLSPNEYKKKINSIILKLNEKKN